MLQARASAISDIRREGDSVVLRYLFARFKDRLIVAFSFVGFCYFYLTILS